MKTVLKFDTGADGFKKMICVLALTAFILLIVGTYFLITLHQILRDMCNERTTLGQ